MYEHKQSNRVHKVEYAKYIQQLNNEIDMINKSLSTKDERVMVDSINELTRRIQYLDKYSDTVTLGGRHKKHRKTKKRKNRRVANK